MGTSISFIKLFLFVSIFTITCCKTYKLAVAVRHTNSTKLFLSIMGFFLLLLCYLKWAIKNNLVLLRGNNFSKIFCAHYSLPSCSWVGSFNVTFPATLRCSFCCTFPTTFILPNFSSILSLHLFLFWCLTFLMESK